MPDQLAGIPADQSGSQVAESPGAHLAHGVGIGAGPDEAHHLLDGQPGRPRGRGQRRQLVELMGRQIPPIRVSANEFHHPGSAATQDQRYRVGPTRGLRRHRGLARAVAPVLPEQPQVAVELIDPCSRILLADIESGELRGP